MSTVSREFALSQLNLARKTIASWESDVRKPSVYEVSGDEPPEYISVRDLEGFNADQFRAEMLAVASLLENLATL